MNHKTTSFKKLLAMSIVIVLSIPSTLNAQSRSYRGQNLRGAGGGRKPIVISEGQLPDTNALRPDGTPIKVRDLVQGKYTVLKTGCLTCPEFLRAYAEVEAAAVDYAQSLASLRLPRS